MARLPVHPSQFEPLLPAVDRRGVKRLRTLADEVGQSSRSLKQGLHPLTEARIAQLLRSVNSYYSNRIEGQHTHPLEIERALKADFSSRPGEACKQRQALAHIEAQKEMEGWLSGGPDVYAPAFLQRLHAAFYQRLTAPDRVMPEGDTVEPGAWRARDVVVGNHHAPDHSVIVRFLERAQTVYDGARGEVERLIAVACAHHRLAWVHPFRDGNGRVMRLQSHAALMRMGVGSPLWAVARGFAREQGAYYARLAAADQPRRGDLDGRGNLTEAGLIAFAEFFLRTCLDQLQFMGALLDFDGWRKRMRAYLTLLSETERDMRREAELPLYHLFLAGEMTRGEFVQMTGLAGRTGNRVLAACFQQGLVESPSPKGILRLGLPLPALAFYFPQLYPEAAA